MTHKLTPHQQVINTLENQLEAAVSALNIFTDHYPGGINPDLDLAWSKARMLLSELVDEDDAILGNDGSESPRETRHKVQAIEWNEDGDGVSRVQTAIYVGGIIDDVRSGDEIIYARAR